MISRQVSSVLMRFALAIVATMAFAVPAQAQARVWTLSGVTFDDGTGATGFIVYNDDTNTITDFSVTVQQSGVSPTLTARTYNLGNSIGFVQNLGSSEDTLLLEALPIVGGGRQFRVTPSIALDGAVSPVPLVLGSLGGGVECFNCSPSRTITGGSLVLTAVVPAMDWAPLVGLMLLLLLTATWMLRRPRSGVMA